MVIDIIFLVMLISGFLMGFRRGAIHSFFSFVALFFGIMIALKFSHQLSFYLNEWLSISTKFLPLISFIVIFIGVILVVRILSAVLEKIVNSIYLGLFNKAVGGMLWCIILTLIFSTLLWFLNQVDLITLEMKSDSQTYPVLESLAPITIDFFSRLIPYFQGLFDSLEQLFERLSESNETLQA